MSEEELASKKALSKLHSGQNSGQHSRSHSREKSPGRGANLISRPMTGEKNSDIAAVQNDGKRPITSGGQSTKTLNGTKSRYLLQESNQNKSQFSQVSSERPVTVTGTKYGGDKSCSNISHSVKQLPAIYQQELKPSQITFEDPDTIEPNLRENQLVSH